ncbi:sensor domain-containing protein [Halosimplex marinum]|uniref:sensor domain-containing protein n=1 Tax=Halosimplex marinum TaxID=3396620 RepID=UPI003F548646
MTTDTVRAALGRFLGVVVDPQTYRNLTYLLLTFPLGVLYFTLIVTGGSAGLSLVPLLVGVPLLLAVLALAALLADFETRLARGLLGTDVTYETPLRVRGEAEPVEFAKRLALDPRSYLAVGYLLSKFAIGIAAFTILVTSATASGAFALAPVLYDRSGITYQMGPWSVETLPAALGVSATGVVLAVVSLHLCNGAAWVVGEYTDAMLGSADRDG